MKLYLLFGLFLLSSCGFAQVADLYIAQTGSGNGSSCSSAVTYTYFNNPTNWGSTAGKIGPGTTVHVCGTLTFPAGASGLTFQSSGTAANPVLVQFEPGAILQAPYWATDPGGAIACVNKSYITIDGGSNGLIRATSNGTAQASQKGSNGIFTSGCRNVEIRNLTIANMYVRTANSSDACDCGFAIRSIDASNYNVHNNVIHDAEYGVYYRYDSSNVSSARIHHNTIYHTATGVVVGDGQAGASVTSVDINDNDIYDDYYWDSPSDVFHCDGIHTWATNSGAVTNGMRIFNNHIHGNMGGHTSGFVYASAVGTVGSSTGLQVFDNLLESSTSCATNGYIFIWQTSEAKLYENTLVGPPGAGSCRGIWVKNVAVGPDIKNNLISNMLAAIYIPSGGGPISSSDYNLINCTGNLGTCLVNQDSPYTLSQWRTGTGFDTHSLGPTAAPSLDSNFQLTAGSLGIDAGTTLGTSWAVDKLGASRPQGSAFDIGAYEFVTGGTIPSPPTGLTALVQ
jgi:hypothetical protein